MIQANLQWIQREWEKWTETDRAKQINPSGWYKVGVQHVAKLFAAHCMESLSSHAPSDHLSLELADRDRQIKGLVADNERLVAESYLAGMEDGAKLVKLASEAEIEHNDH